MLVSSRSRAAKIEQYLVRNSVHEQDTSAMKFSKELNNSSQFVGSNKINERQILSSNSIL